MLLERLKNTIAAHQSAGLYRQRIVCNDSQVVLNFSSNDYLSLSKHPRLQAAYQTGYQCYPTGSGGSPLSAGYHPVHRAFEQAFAEALGVDDALFFSSGYAANLSLMALLTQLDVLIYMDKAMHASAYDGIVSDHTRYKRYRHCDIDDLQRRIIPHEPAVFLTESLFSMSGQIAPLKALAELALQSGSSLFVDEAHAFGVMGQEGLGLVNALNLTQSQVPLRVIPLGKAFAGSGAIIAGQADWIDALIQVARPYIYSTAPSPAMTYGLLQTLDIIRAADERRAALNALIDYFRSAIQTSRFTWRNSFSAIQQLQLGCPQKAQALSLQLLKQGIVCMPMRQPTVTKQETGLRVILNYQHQPDDIDHLLRCLQ